ncbi:MAG: glycosyltransferase [Candidatus Margulisiibacteriota bacterium]
MNSFLSKAAYIAFLVFFGYSVVLTLYYAILAVIGLFEGRRRALESETEDYPLVYLSTFSIPVSIIMPARNEEGWIRDSLLSILNLNYPNFEVIVVDDGSTDKTLDILKEVLDPAPIDAPYIKHYRDGVVREILKSKIHPNVMIISKSAGLKKAGAVNAGLNMANNDYICLIDADTILEPDSLLKVMAAIAKDPDGVAGVGSYFGLVNGLKIENGRIIKRSFSYNNIIAYQNLEYIRSFIGNRLAWSKFNAMPTIAGGFGVWRRDILYKLGGFSRDFTCEDIEMTFRVHDYISRNRPRASKILMLPYSTGWTEGPSNISSLISQRERWQRVTNETLWHYKYMILNPKFGSFAFVTLPYFVLYEVFGVFFEATSLALVTIGWINGALDLKVFFAFFILMISSQVAISLLSVLAFVRAQKVFGLRYIAYLVTLSFFEFFLYRWITSTAKIVGTYRWLRGAKGFDQYARKKRVPIEK